MRAAQTGVSPIEEGEQKAQKEVLKRLLSYAFPYWKVLLFAFFLLMLATGLELIGPILVQMFIDDHLIPKNFDVPRITLLASCYFVFYIGAAISMYYQDYLFQRTAHYIIQDIRTHIFGCIQHFSIRFFDRMPTGALVSRITNDTEAIKELYVRVLSIFLQSSIFLVGIFIAMFYLNSRLAIFCLLLVPVILLLMGFYQRLSRQAYQLTRQKLSQINAYLIESLQGMEMIQAFNQERRFRQQFYHLTHQHYQAHLKTVRLNALLLRPATDFIYLVIIVLILGYFGQRSFVSSVEIGVVWAFVTYLDRFFEPINTMMQNLAPVQQALVAGERVFGLLDQQEEEWLATTKRGVADFSIEKGKIEFKNVSFSYLDGQPVLKNISFVIQPGQTVAFVGPTGSGKSTVANLLLGFYQISQGQILIDDRPLEMYSLKELRKKIGLVHQDPFLFAGTIRSNITLNDSSLSAEEMEQAVKWVQADSWIKQLPQQYDQPVKERGSTLSTGERQLISLARTLVRKPKILILDEATANIDTETEEKIKAALDLATQNRTVVMIAHRLSTVEEADQIFVLYKGEIVEQGTHQDLLTLGGLYKKMYQLQRGE